ncbi:MAG: replicative DNA helicase [Anaerovoracaceae bacterium]|nr:replicative DNA helicase [Anaerovoracaceae bacterium]
MEEYSGMYEDNNDTGAGRVPPNNTEAERSALGAAMLDKEALFAVLENVSAEDFYDSRNKEIYEAISSLSRAGVNVDTITVCNELEKRGSLQMIGGRAYVAGVSSTDAVPVLSNAGEYAKIVAEKAKLRALIAAAGDIVELGYRKDIDAREAVEEAERSIFSIAQSRSSGRPVPIAEVLRQNLKEIEERTRRKDIVSGVPTGLIDIDNRTTGFQKSDMIIVAARPSMGKTAFALTVAKNAAQKGNKVLIFSLEMAKTQLTQRLIAMESAVDSDNLRKGRLEQPEWDRIMVAVDSLGSMSIDIDESSGITLLEMKNKCRRKKMETGLDLVIVDYLQMMDYGGRAESRQQEITALSRGLKQLAREMECPVVVLSQLSRAPEQRQDHRPVMSDLRESGSIEQDADVILMLYRDEFYYKEESEKPGICEVIIAKQRNGPTGTVEIRWQSKFNRFVNKG